MTFNQGARTRRLDVLGLGLILLLATLGTGCGSDTPAAPTTPFAVDRALVEVPPHASSWTSNSPCPSGVGLIVYVIGPKDQTQYQSYSYRWEKSDGTVDGPYTRGIAPTTGAAPFADNYTYMVWIPKTDTGWIQLHVLSPNDVVSGRVTWNVTCPAS